MRFSRPTSRRKPRPATGVRVASITVFLSLLSSTGVVSAVQAQESGLTFTPRLGASFTSPGAGFNGTGAIEGFLPFQRSAERSLNFLEGRFFSDTDEGNRGAMSFSGIVACRERTGFLVGIWPMTPGTPVIPSFRRLASALKPLPSAVV